RTFGGALRPELKPRLAEALLEPFSRQTADDAFQAWARPFLLGHLNDPRRSPVAWSDVSERAQRVMLRWLVQDTIDQFFHVLDRTAKSRHWKDRKRFWQRYVDADAISNAWVILGTDACRFARRS